MIIILFHYQTLVFAADVCITCSLFTGLISLSKTYLFGGEKCLGLVPHKCIAQLLPFDVHVQPDGNLEKVSI